MRLRSLLILSYIILVLSCSNNKIEKKTQSNYSNLTMSSPLSETLKSISINAIDLGDIDYSSYIKTNKWLGTKPALDNQIKQAEKRLNIEFPKEYLDFLNVTNGFEATSTIYPAFHSVDKIDYLNNIDKYQVNLWMQEGTEEIGYCLKRSIIIAGINDDQYFLLIPPLKNEKWQYWSFASWYPGEVVYDNFTDFWIEVDEFLIDNIE